MQPPLPRPGWLTDGVRLSRELDAAMFQLLHPLLELHLLLHDLQEAALKPKQQGQDSGDLPRTHTSSVGKGSLTCSFSMATCRAWGLSSDPQLSPLLGTRACSVGSLWDGAAR